MTLAIPLDTIADDVFRETNDHEQESYVFAKTVLLRAMSQRSHISVTGLATFELLSYIHPSRICHQIDRRILTVLSLSDVEVEHAYLFDYCLERARQGGIGPQHLPEDVRNFRRRLLEYEEDTGRDLRERDRLPDSYRHTAGPNTTDDASLLDGMWTR